MRTALNVLYLALSLLAMAGFVAVACGWEPPTGVIAYTAFFALAITAAGAIGDRQ